MSRLRKWFGPSKEEIWQQLRDQIGGSLVAGDFWNGSKLEVRHKEWTVTLDTYTVSTGKSFGHLTRMRAPYVNPDALSLLSTGRGFLAPSANGSGCRTCASGIPSLTKHSSSRATTIGSCVSCSPTKGSGS